MEQSACTNELPIYSKRPVYGPSSLGYAAEALTALNTRITYLEDLESAETLGTLRIAAKRLSEAAAYAMPTDASYVSIALCAPLCRVMSLPHPVTAIEFPVTPGIGRVSKCLILATSNHEWLRKLRGEPESFAANDMISFSLFVASEKHDWSPAPYLYWVYPETLSASEQADGDVAIKFYQWDFMASSHSSRALSTPVKDECESEAHAFYNTAMNALAAFCLSANRELIA